MGRWTVNDEEAKHLADIISQMQACIPYGTAKLKDGRTFYGIILPGSAGNNLGAGGSWKYYADVGVRVKNEDESFTDHTFDVLDVAELIPGRLN